MRNKIKRSHLAPYFLKVILLVVCQSTITSCFLASTLSAQAQITPDSSLPNNSIITPNGSTLNITGGTQTDINLFHSFQQFSVLTGQTAYFNNSLNVQNILSRITGGNISNINGTIQTNGTANLFLLNPNGIIFGPNAQLRIGGSFLGTTANSIKLSDGSTFSTINPSAPSLLAINVPIGLQFGANPGSILNQSKATGRSLLPPQIPIPNTIGLTVPTGKTLSLIGGDILLDGGNLTASNGQIQLGSVKSQGFVAFTPTPFGFSLNYENIQNFGNISLTAGSLINTSGLGGGKVEIRGGNVSLSNARIYALTFLNNDGRGIDINAQQLQVKDGSQIFTITFGGGKSGDINLNVSDSIDITGVGFARYQQRTFDLVRGATFDPFDPQLVLASGTFGAGDAGKININTGSLRLREGVTGGAGTFAAGNGGKMTIHANNIEIVGSILNNGSLAPNAGAGGDINVETQNLILRDGGNLSSTTNSNKPSGDINIKASESVQVIRTFSDTELVTLIGTNSFNGSGKAGDINIDTKRLVVTEGAGISSGSGAIFSQIVTSVTGGLGGSIKINATDSVELSGISTFLDNTINPPTPSPSFIAAQTTSNSRGGDIEITTPVLTLRDGGVITAASLGTGDAGNIRINAQRLQITGKNGPNGRYPSKIEATAGSLYGLVNPNATGNAGELNLNTQQLLVQDGAKVTVEAFGTGSAGNINIVGKAITLDQGSINAKTGSGAGGNINLESQDILLRRGSQISTNAENTTGGNININTNTLVAVPVENSDITANAQKGTGGRVLISTDGIFGIQFRDQLTPKSDITATSDLGPQFQGIVQIDVKGTEINRGLLELPETVVDPSKLIATGCNNNSSSRFVVTGSGGLPEDPRDTLRGQVIVQDLRPINPSQRTTAPSKSASNSLKSQPVIPLIEATGWLIEPDGTVQLVANSATVGALVSSPQDCQGNYRSALDKKQ
jgi:filamentous hemagglutinin family protein